MRVTIRQGVFETNSSSTHSLTRVSRLEFDGWRKGRFYLNEGNKDLPKMCTSIEIINYVEKRRIPTTKMSALGTERFFATLGIYSFDLWFELPFKRLTITKGDGVDEISLEYRGFDWGIE